jgi:hypothetical protein
MIDVQALGPYNPTKGARAAPFFCGCRDKQRTPAARALSGEVDAGSPQKMRPVKEK